MCNGKCNHTVPCGCGDQPFTTPTSCNSGTPECPTPDNCPETFCAGCVVYCGDSILDLGIMQGDRMDRVIQMLTLAIVNPGCFIPSLSRAITGISISAIGAGYTVSNTFPNTPLLGGTGSGAIGTVVTGASGEITSVTVTSSGLGYTTGDQLYPDPAVVGVPVTPAVFIITIVECKAVTGLHSTIISSTTISLAWLMEQSAVNYQVEYKEATAIAWTLNATITPSANPTDIIGGLTPDTEYHIRVNNICTDGSCQSVIIIVKTKP